MSSQKAPRPSLLHRSLRIVSTAFLVAAALPGCAAISRINLIPVSQDPQLGAEAYPSLLEGESQIDRGSDHAMVVRMTDRLVAAAKEIDPEVANLFEWEVRLVNRDDLVNAWCLPGGKMAVYTGILPVAQGETGLAVVMGHEIAHATLRHGTRAMTRQMGTQAILGLLGAALGGGDGETAAITGAAASFGANFLNLSFGRDAELEADARGLRYMATAGYDPREAVDFWRRMNAAAGGAGQPEWLSTHPSNENRISQIESLLPEALAIYERKALER